MSLIVIINYFYLGLLTIVAGIGIAKRKFFNMQFRNVYYLIVFAMFGEYSALIAKEILHTKSPVYNFTCIVSLYIVASYFTTNLFPLHYRKIMAFTAAGLVGITLLNFYFFDFFQLYTNTFILRSFLVVAMSLYGLYRIFINDEIIDPIGYVHFWAWVLLLVLYAGTYFYWSYVKILSADGKGKFQDILAYIQEAINIIVYSGFGIIFLLHPKKFR